MGNFQIQELCLYLALPSIKKLKLMEIRTWEDLYSEHYDWKYGNRTSTVEEIDVYEGASDFITIGRFLQPLVKLGVFHWTHGCGYTDECEDWGGNAFVQMMGMKVGWHLQELGLTFTHSTQCVSATRIESFLRFRTLTYLELDLQYLLGKVNIERNEDPNSDEKWLPLRPEQRLRCIPPRLIDILPSSIQTVRLWVSDRVMKPECMLQHVTRLRNLKQITIAYYLREENHTRGGPREPFPPLPAHPLHAIAQDLKSFGVNLDVVGSRGPLGLWRRNCAPDSDHLYTPAEMLPSTMEDPDVDVNVGPV